MSFSSAKQTGTSVMLPAGRSSPADSTSPARPTRPLAVLSREEVTLAAVVEAMAGHNHPLLIFDPAEDHRRLLAMKGLSGVLVDSDAYSSMRALAQCTSPLVREFSRTFFVLIARPFTLE